ncbi:MAG: hypothetical protein Q9163_003742 [Psora crenata]
MVARKRGREEMEALEPQQEPSLLEKLRNTWEFANIMQYIFIFGRAVKIDEDFDIEIFDEYTRRQYMAKAPHRNPFGEDEEPKKFSGFDIFTKLKVLVQLSQWTLNNADRLREKMEERTESEQSVAWRMNEIGYDKHERYYFVLDDNRLYRRTEAPLPIPPRTSKPKAGTRKAKAAARSSKRRSTKEAIESANDSDVGRPQPEDDGEEVKVPAEDNGFGGRKWECVAITLSQYQDFLESIKKTRDPDEKALYKRVTEEVMPVIEQVQASQLRKKQRQERELLNIQKLATAKRSSRLEAKMDRERQEREEREAQRKRKADLAEAHAYERQQQKMAEDRESRMMTREQRLRERELKRILHEEELARMSEEEERVGAGESRLSERQLKAEMEKKKRELAALEEDVWFFDCSKCGVHGENLDDGSHIVACGKCNVWQHSACLNISQQDAEKDNFHFLCYDCERREEDAKKPKIPSLKFKLGSSTSPNQKANLVLPVANEARKRKSEDDGAQPSTKKNKHSDHFPNQHPPTLNMQDGMHATAMDSPTPSVQGQVPEKSSQPLYVVDYCPTSEQRPPYIEIPPSGTPLTNGCNGHHNSSDTYTSRALDLAFQPLPLASNGYHQGTYQPFGGHYDSKPPQSYQAQLNPAHRRHAPGWSARYVAPSQSQDQAQFQSDTAHTPPRADQDPFTNTMNGNRPRSSHGPDSARGLSTAKDRSPLKNGPLASPAQRQLQTPSSSFAAPPLPLSATPEANCNLTNTANNSSQLVGTPSQSPWKHPSPPSTQTNHHLPPSSPVPYQPALPANGPTTPGFSPVKHSPPQQKATPSGLGILGNVNVLPVVPKLAPSPPQQQSQQYATAPVKGGMPERSGQQS